MRLCFLCGENTDSPSRAAKNFSTCIWKILFDYLDRPLPLGWVLENDFGRVVGCFCNIPLGYEWNERPLLAAASNSWVVEEEYRSLSIALLMKFLRQKNVHFLLNTTANLEASKIMEAVKSKRMPRTDYGDYLTWILNYPAFVKSVLRMRRWSSAEILRYPIAFCLKSRDILLRRNRKPPLGASVVERRDLDEQFDVFWSELRKQRDTLLAVRSVEALNWHFKFALREGNIKIFIAKQQNKMRGYAVILRSDRKDIDLHRYRIADMQIFPPSSRIATELLAAALNYAWRRQGSIFEIIGQNTCKRRGSNPSALIGVRPFAGLSGIKRSISRPRCKSTIPIPGTLPFSMEIRHYN